MVALEPCGESVIAVNLRAGPFGRLGTTTRDFMRPPLVVIWRYKASLKPTAKMTDRKRARERCDVTGDPRAEDGTGLRGGRGSKFERLKLSGSRASQGVIRTRIASAFLLSGRILCDRYAPQEVLYCVCGGSHLLRRSLFSTKHPRGFPESHLADPRSLCLLPFHGILRFHTN